VAGEAEAPARSGGAAVEGGFEGGEVGADGGEGVGVGDGVWEGMEGVEEVEGANAVVLGGVGRVEGLEEVEERRVKGTRAKQAVVEVEAEIGSGFGVVKERGEEAREVIGVGVG